jgi:hypothetical protein
LVKLSRGSEMELPAANPVPVPLYSQIPQGLARHRIRVSVVTGR